MKVKDILERHTRPPVTVSGDQNIKEAIKLMVGEQIGSVIVVDESGMPVGIVTERDIMSMTHKFQGKITHMKIADHMTTDLIIGVPDDDVGYIAQVITQSRIRHIPIIGVNKKLVGIVSIGDIVKARLDMAQIRLRHLEEYITGRAHPESE